MNTDYAISAIGLKKSYGDLKVLDGVDINVERGTIMALLGPNGAGKTTTVRILATLLQADAGEVVIEGFNLEEDADKVRSVIGLTGQYTAIDEFLTGRENLRMMGGLYHLSKKDTHARTEELLKQFDLLDAADRTAKTYSGGMRRRLDLASSLIAAPPVLFLDEPTTGLDPRSRVKMWDIIADLVKRGSTILLTTQYLDEADQLADKIVVIDDGKVIAEGTADQLKNKVGSERVYLTFASLDDMKNAKKLFRGDVVIDEKKKSLSIANKDGVSRVKTIIEKLETSEIEVDSLSIHKPTLDDVFMQLTGHQASKKEDVEEEK